MSPPDTPPLPPAVYHLALSGEWEAAVSQGGHYRRSTLGRSLEQQGFIHCSFGDQVETIANLIYRGRNDVLLLTIDTAELRAEVRVENLEGGASLFPHVYGPLPIAAVVRIQPIPVDEEGRLLVRHLADPEEPMERTSR